MRSGMYRYRPKQASPEAKTRSRLKISNKRTSQHLGQSICIGRQHVNCFNEIVDRVGRLAVCENRKSIGVTVADCEEIFSDRVDEATRDTLFDPETQDHVHCVDRVRTVELSRDKRYLDVRIYRRHADAWPGLQHVSTGQKMRILCFRQCTYEPRSATRCFMDVRIVRNEDGKISLRQTKRSSRSLARLTLDAFLLRWQKPDR